MLGYGQQVGDTHPTGMHFSLFSFFIQQRGHLKLLKINFKCSTIQGLSAGCTYVGSGDPVRVLRLLHTMNTLDTL